MKSQLIICTCFVFNDAFVFPCVLYVHILYGGVQVRVFYSAKCVGKCDVTLLQALYWQNHRVMDHIVIGKLS